MTNQIEANGAQSANAKPHTNTNRSAMVARFNGDQIGCGCHVGNRVGGRGKWVSAGSLGSSGRDQSSASGMQ